MEIYGHYHLFVVVESKDKRWDIEEMPYTKYIMMRRWHRKGKREIWYNQSGIPVSYYPFYAN